MFFTSKNYLNVSFFQPKFEKCILNDNWYNIKSKLSQKDIEIISIVINAKYDEEVDNKIWNECEYILKKINKIDENLRNIKR